MELIIGAGVSLIVQAIKQFAGTNRWITLACVLVLSILASIGYAILNSTGLLVKLIPILTSAGAFYTYILHQFEGQG